MKPERFDPAAYALMKAVMKGNVAAVQAELVKRPDTDWQDSEGHAALHYAIVAGRADIVQMLVTAGANAHIRDEKERIGTPLSLAASLGDLAIAKLLIQAGVTPRNDPEEEALHNAVSSGHRDMAQLLLDAGFPVDFVPTASRAPLMIAATLGDVPMMELLMQAKPKVDLTDMRNYTALHWAATAADAAAVTFLLEQGADAAARTIHGYTPLRIAEERGEPAIAAALHDAHGIRARAEARKTQAAQEEERTRQKQREDALRGFKEGTGHGVKVAARPARFRPKP